MKRSILATLCIVSTLSVIMSIGGAAQGAEGIRSANPVERIAAYDALKKASRTLGPTELLGLLERENQLIAATLRESGGEVGVSGKYGEGYGEYYAEVIEECDARCDKQNPRTIAALAGGAYNSGSDFAQKLAREHGQRILPLMLQKSRSDLGLFRSGALQMLGTIVATNPKLSPADMATIRSAVIAAAGDGLSSVRHSAVRTLGNIGDARDVALLERIAQQDAERDINARTTRYPVREEAERALTKIKSRGQRGTQ